MYRASQRRLARILNVLLGVEGEGRKQYWAREIAGNIPILRHAAMYGSLATVQVCLAAGADENFVNATGMTAADLGGMYAPSNTKNADKLSAAICGNFREDQRSVLDLGCGLLRWMLVLVLLRPWPYPAGHWQLLLVFASFGRGTIDSSRHALPGETGIYCFRSNQQYVTADRGSAVVVVRYFVGVGGNDGWSLSPT